MAPLIKRVVEVRPLGGYRLFIRFDDGVQGEVDIASYVDLGTVCWPNDLDLAPEVLYEKASGCSLSV
jgi:hypothetical protein